MRDCVIRRAEQTDVPQLCMLETECFSCPWSETAFSDTMSGDGAVFLVCEGADGKCIGYIGAVCTLDECSVTNVCVSAEYRGQGIGNALMAALEQKVLSCGCNAVLLEVRVSNAAALSMYEKRGYERCGVRRGFYSHPREDALVMKKEL